LRAIQKNKETKKKIRRKRAKKTTYEKMHKRYYNYILIGL